MAVYEKTTGTSGILRMVITYEQSVANNQTTFTVSYQLANSNSQTNFSNVIWFGNTAGTNRSGAVSISGVETKTLGSWTVTKTHNADGTLPSAARTFTIGINATGTTGVGGPTTNSVTISVPNIARKSNITSVSGGTVEINGTNTVNVGIERFSSSFTHTVKITLGSKSWTQTGVGTGTSYAVPMSWLEEVTSSTSRSGTITLTTYSGSTNLGSTSKSWVATVPASVIPSIGSVSIVRDNKDTPAAWNLWVQNHSAAQVTVSGAAGAYGSTIASTRVTVGTWTKWGNPVEFDISGSGSLTFTATVTDTRGRTASKSATISVVPYSDISISKVDISRGTPGQFGFEPDPDSGLWGAVSPVFTHTSISGKNVPKMTVRTQAAGNTTWTTEFTNITTSSGEWELIGGGSLSPDSSYNVEVTLSDTFSTKTYLGFIPTAFATMDFLHGGRGIAFGKVSSKVDTFEVDFNTEFNKTVDFHSASNFQGTSTHNGQVNFNSGVDFGGLLKFNSLPPIVERTDGSSTITATSMTEYNITANAPVAITLSQPTWYTLTYRAWIYITGGIGEHRIGIQLDGATTKAVSSPTWGDVLRQSSVGNGTRDELTIDYLLNAGTTNVRVMGHKTGTPVHTVNYQLFRAIPRFPGYTPA